MTNDFKKTLLQYFTGNLEKDTGVTKEIIQKISSIPLSDFDGYYVPNSKLTIRGMVRDSSSGNVVLYGGYEDGNILKGIIIVLNQDFKPLKVFYKFSSGTDLRYIHSMNQDESGNYYYIDSNTLGSTTAERRLVLVNNVSQSSSVTLRKTYSFPNGYNDFYCYNVYKDVNSANYVFVGTKPPDYDDFKIISVKIDVGTTNEWKQWNSSGGWILGGSFVNFDSDGNLFCETIITRSMNNASTLNAVSIWKKDYTSDDFALSNLNIPFDYKPYIDNDNYHNQSVFINKDEVYFVSTNQSIFLRDVIENKYIELYYYNLSTNEYKKIYSKFLGEYVECDLEAIYLNKNQNDVYIQYNVIQDGTPIADYYFQRYVDRWFPLKIADKQPFYHGTRLLYINNTYNLVNAYMISTTFDSFYWSVYNILEIYNKNNFNGETYINTNSLLPNSSVLYNENNDVVFARNLYNKTISERTTQATLEIPNNYLNDVVIAKQNLISETNLTMVENQNTVTKNVYETVYLNFINTLQMINNNNEENPILNSNGAIRLNNSISNLIDYDNSKMGKAKINFEDGTSSIIPIAFTQNGNVMRTEFTITVDKNITNIQLLSNDETTIYQTIETQLSINKTYTISQDVTVEGVQL